MCECRNNDKVVVGSSTIAALGSDNGGVDGGILSTNWGARRVVGINYQV